MANKSIFDAFERMWQHTVAKLGLKADKAEIQETYETKAAAGDKLAEAKTYTDEAAAAVKNDLLNGAGEAYDTLKELGDLINENQDALDALETVATGKAEKEHIHAISDVVDLQTQLNNKEFITFEQFSQLEGVTVELNTETETGKRYDIIFSKEFFTDKVLKLYDEDKYTMYSFYVLAEDGSRISLMSPASMGSVTYVTFANTYYSTYSPYRYYMLYISTITNGTRGLTANHARVSFDKTTGAYVSHESNYLQDYTNLVSDVNNRSAEKSYAPEKETDITTKKYVDDAIANISGLPPYTAEDEGKILRIVNGVPAWVLLPSAEEASF